jgi:hypothetical protein
MMADQGSHDPGRQPSKGGMRLLRTVGRAELVGPVTQRNIGVWLGLTLVAVIVGLDMVGGRNAELLVSPPILAASFVGPKRTVAVGVVALAAAIGYGRAVGVDLLAGSQGVPAVAIGAATVLSALVARVRVEREGRLRAVTKEGAQPGGPRVATSQVRGRHRIPVIRHTGTTQDGMGSRRRRVNEGAAEPRFARR